MCIRDRDLLYDARLCLEGCELCAKAAPEVIERALNGLLIHREKLTPEHLTALTDCCPTQALTVCGEVKSVEEIMATVLRDKPFYDRSGGGLTLSGGEPFMQPEMATALLQASHEAGIHLSLIHISHQVAEQQLTAHGCKDDAAHEKSVRRYPFPPPRPDTSPVPDRQSLPPRPYRA